MKTTQTRKKEVKEAREPKELSVEDAFAAMPLQNLKAVWDGIERNITSLEAQSTLVKNELMRRHGKVLEERLNAQGKHHGELTTKDFSVPLVFKISRKVVWNQEALEKMMQADTSLYKRIIKADLSVSETIYDSSANIDKNLFESLKQARIVKYSTPTLAFVKE